MVARIEALAPGFAKKVMSRHARAPADLEPWNANLPGDQRGANSRGRPSLLFPHYVSRTPVRGLYLASSDVHPGPGTHGMCGYHAAQAVLREL
jgi:phytoene dehydrogenase-like protein